MISKAFPSFSVLKKMKTNVRSNINNNRLNYLMVMHIYQENIEKIIFQREDVNFVQWILVKSLA